MLRLSDKILLERMTSRVLGSDKKQVIEKEFTISILVIDNDAANRRLLSDTLQAFGYEIIQTAKSPMGEDYNLLGQR